MARIQVNLEGAVAKVILDRSPGNRIDFVMREEFLSAFRRVAASDARVLLVKGTGPDFCQGGDVRDWLDLPSSVLRPKIEVFAEALEALRHLEIPTVAVVQGACRGGGFELAMTCDFIIAARSAAFCFPESKAGILTLQGGVMQLAQRIGVSKALELVLLGETIDAEELHHWNVVNRVVADASLGREAAVLAERLARVPPQVCAKTKSLLRTWLEKGPESAMGAWYGLSMPLFDLEDTRTRLRRGAEAIGKVG